MGPGKLAFLSVLMACLAAFHTASALTGSIELISPGNGSWTDKTNTDLPFTFRFTDPDNATANCTLSLNDVLYGPYLTENHTEKGIYSDDDFSPGYNEWKIICFNGTVINSGTRAFFADRENPAVSLTSPADTETAGPGTIDFYFNYTDGLSEQAYCVLLVNGSEEDGGDVPNGTESFLSASLGEGHYEWRARTAPAIPEGRPYSC
jgi:hypothetical protein